MNLSQRTLNFSQRTFEIALRVHVFLSAYMNFSLQRTFLSAQSVHFEYKLHVTLLKYSKISICFLFILTNDYHHITMFSFAI